jgi:phage gp29-like protein
MPLPSLKTFLELPISVQHSWESYGVVDDALVQLEQGQFQAAALLADAVWTDDRVIACLSTRINAVFGLPMTFKYQGQEGKETAGANADEKADEEQESPEVTALKQKIAQLAAKYWERMVPDAAAKELLRWGILLNAGVGENAWSWEGDLLLPTLKTWNPQFIYWRWDTRSYWLIHQDGVTELAPGDGRWSLFAPTGHNHGWLYGLIRALGKLWLDRVFNNRDWSRAGEKYSLGIIKGKVPADGAKEDKTRFEQGLRRVSSESTILLPQTKDGGFDVEMMETDTAVNWQSFKERQQQIDINIAVLILGQNLTTEVSGGMGSKAAVGGHDQVRIDYLKSDAKTFTAVVKAQVLGPWVRYNWEDEAERLGVPWQDLVPDVAFLVPEEDDEAADADVVSKVADAVPNLTGAGADVKKLLEKHDIPVLEGGAPELEPKQSDDANQRPREARDDGSSRQPLEGEQLSRRPTPKLKAGAKKGQVLVDELADKARTAAKEALAKKKLQLLQVVAKGGTYQEIRDGVLKLYQGWKTDKELREIVEGAVTASELIGRVSSHVDRK